MLGRRIRKSAQTCNPRNARSKIILKNVTRNRRSGWTSGVIYSLISRGSWGCTGQRAANQKKGTFAFRTATRGIEGS